MRSVQPFPNYVNALFVPTRSDEIPCVILNVLLLNMLSNIRSFEFRVTVSQHIELDNVNHILFMISINRFGIHLCVHQEPFKNQQVLDWVGISSHVMSSEDSVNDAISYRPPLIA